MGSPYTIELLLIKKDTLGESQKLNKIVIPAKAGIHEYPIVTKHWTPVLTGVTTFYDAVTKGSLNSILFI
jgi:hypothetical protein